MQFQYPVIMVLGSFVARAVHVCFSRRSIFIWCGWPVMTSCIITVGQKSPSERKLIYLCGRCTIISEGTLYSLGKIYTKTFEFCLCSRDTIANPLLHRLLTSENEPIRTGAGQQGQFLTSSVCADTPTILITHILENSFPNTNTFVHTTNRKRWIRSVQQYRCD